MYRPPRGPKASKFVHQWLRPMRVVEPAGYDNYLVEREDDASDRERFIAHASFLVSYYYPATLLNAAAADLEEQLEHEGAFEVQADVETPGATTNATTAPANAVVRERSTKRRVRTVVGASGTGRQDEYVVELRRRRRRNAAGQYVLEYELRPAGRRRNGAGTTSDGRRWVSAKEYERLFRDARVVEDSEIGEDV